MAKRIVTLLLLALPCYGSNSGAAEPDVEALYREFRNPPPSYSISPYWFWNGKITAAETRRQIGEMVKQGVRSAVLMTWAGMEPDYLSEAYWHEVGIALEAARDAGLTLNFADEYLWPSGQAWDYASLKREPSRVLQLHPEFRMRRLTCRRLSPGVPATLDADPEAVVAARLTASGEIDDQSLTLLPTSRHLEWKPPEGNWTIFVYTPVPAVDRGVRVDLLNPSAVSAFIDLVYGEFARRFPQHLGSTIKFFVSDHEGSYGAALAFTPALWRIFQQRHGYDLRRFLPLADRSTPQSAKVRQDYLETIAHLYTTSFVGQITEWCARHGVEHGHSDIEESLLLQTLWTGDMFSLWRASSAVYIDALLDRGRMPIDFQEAASVAHFEGRPFMVENQGLTGHDSYWSLERARLGTNMCLLWGVNRLIPHYLEYDPDHLQFPPSWFLTQPLWRYFHLYADVARRALFMNAQGRHNASIAIYYPLESASAGSEGVFKEGQRSMYRWGNSMDQAQDYYSALQLELTRLGWDYHILDSYYIQKGKVSGPNLELAGEQFRVLILPPMTHIADTSAGQIRRFADAGGLVLALGWQPLALDGIAMRRFPVHEHKVFMDHLDYTEQIQVPDPVRADLAPLLDTLLSKEPQEVEIVSGARDHFFFKRRFTSTAEWYWAVNDSPDVRRVTVRFPVKGAFEKWDAETGGRVVLPSNGQVVTLDFGPWDAYFIVRHGNSSTAPQAETSARQLLLELPNSGWQFTPEAPVRVPYARIEGSAEPVWLAPERLANRNWWLAGPFPDKNGQGFFDPNPPERGFEPKDPAWKWFESPTSAVRPATKTGIYYAYANIWSPKSRRAEAVVVPSHSVKLWWNGELKFAFNSRPVFVLLREGWAHRVPVELRKGWNSVLLKVGATSRSAGFLFLMEDEQGKVLRDIVYARDRVLLPSVPRRVHLDLDAPPGTEGKSLSLEVNDQEIPDRAIAFSPRTTPFTLASWTDSTLANYSGSALYETSFELLEQPAGTRLVLDLGKVGLAAEVWLNGQKAGERGWRPFEFDITPYVRRGINRLRVRVANSNAGWMAQGDPIYEGGAWGVTFASERDRLRTLRPNGLEGPVRILAVK